MKLKVSKLIKQTIYAINGTIDSTKFIGQNYLFLFFQPIKLQSQIGILYCTLTVDRDTQ